MLDAFALSDKGCVRSNNEDYGLIDPERGLFILADGMGGARAGERASRLAVETVAELVRSAPVPDSQVLIRATEEANRRVLSAAQNDPALEGMGSGGSSRMRRSKRSTSGASRSSGRCTQPFAPSSQ